MTVGRPVPVPDELTAPFWAAAASGELVLPRCSRCTRMTLPPDPVCPHCGTTAPDWHYERVSGNGRVRTWTIVRQAFLPGFEVPLLLVDVEVLEHPDLRIIGRLVGGVDAGLRAGALVRTEFDRLTEDVAVAVFRLAGET